LVGLLVLLLVGLLVLLLVGLLVFLLVGLLVFLWVFLLVGLKVGLWVFLLDYINNKTTLHQNIFQVGMFHTQLNPVKNKNSLHILHTHRTPYSVE
jgi:hypothetical protein